MSNTKDWTTPNENAEIDVPDELMPLFNQIGTQIRLHTISGKNEVLTIAHCVRNAERFFHSRISELEGKVEFYRRETNKLRDYLEEHNIGKPSQKLFDALYEHIAELEAENKRLIEQHRWIPVTERLPETSMWVLCICSEERHWLAFRALNGWYIDTSFGQKFVGDQDATKHIKIQHWQPLTFPQPPKEQ